MDENRFPYSLKAPGSSGSPMSLPGRGPFPRVDEHLVVPELTRDEIIGGRRVVASPAHPPHATQQFNLDYVLRAHVAPGYRGANDLLTRHDHDSDFATDACVLKEGTDPATGARYLEELAFEVVSEQNQGLVYEKAVRMHRRGVRRIFTVWVKGRRRVCEWSPENQSWRELDAGAHIEDPCLVKPVSVAALLDAAEADNAVVEALSVKDNPALRTREAAAEARGEARGLEAGRAAGMAEAILRFLEFRGVAVQEDQRRQILECRDLDRLDRWLRKAADAASAEEILADA